VVRVSTEAWKGAGTGICRYMGLGDAALRLKRRPPAKVKFHRFLPAMVARALLALALAAPTATCAFRPPAALTRRQCTASAAVAAAAVAASLPHRAIAQGPAPERFVVDRQAEPGGAYQAEPGGAYSTISAALSAAPKGATVVVRPGLYTERVFLKSDVSILGDKGAVLSWTSDRPYEVRVRVRVSSP